MNNLLKYTTVFIVMLTVFNCGKDDDNKSSEQELQTGAIMETPTTGTLDGVSFTLTNIGTPEISINDLNGASFSAAPLSNSETCWAVNESSNWTITFDSPISNLRLYCVSWRTNTALFDQPFTILPGSSNIQNPNGNEISTTFWANGIIEFTNPITVLNLSTSSLNGSQIAITFGVSSI